MLPFTESQLPVLVVGAGPAGLAMMGELKAAGIPFQCAESSTAVGGLWSAVNSSSPAYDSLTTNSSKATTTLSLPMPASAPHFLSRQQAEEYLLRFAAHHQLQPHVLFSTTVVSLSRPDGSNTWTATLANAVTGELSTVEYRAAIVAVSPQSRASANIPPELWQQAKAAGIPCIHSCDYRNPAPYQGKSVLVVGMGNSGAEITAELSRATRRCLLSVRRTPWIVPLWLLGRPADVVAQSDFGPHALQMAAFHCLQRLYVGHPCSLGFPAPDHDLLDRLPVSDRGIVSAIRSKRVELHRDVAGIGSAGVAFVDAPAVAHQVDAIILATGYRRQLPFLSAALQSATLSLSLFHPSEAGLMFLTELTVPAGGWPVFALQSKAITAYLQADARHSPRCLTPQLAAPRGVA